MSIEHLTRTVFAFGTVGKAPYGHVSFHPDGRVRLYSNPNEAFFRYDDGVLSFLDANGLVTSTLKSVSASPLVFHPYNKGEHYLEPVFTLPPSRSTRQDVPAVLVNTLPKAGTYMVARALQDAGLVQVDVHLSAKFLHDNIEMDPDDIHWHPQERAVSVPASAVASLLRPGEFVVGHIDALDELSMIRQLPVEVLNVVRSPYDQILSMMKFRQSKVKPKEKDEVWLSMQGLDQLKAFVISQPVATWLQFSRTLTDNLPYLRFEDLKQKRITEEGLSEHMAKVLKQGLDSAVGAKTSTLLHETPPDWYAHLQDPAIWAFLGSLGMHDYAKAIWPDHQLEPS